MEWLLILSPLLAPLVVVIIVRRFAAGSLWLQLGAAAVSGAVTGAFLLSAASAMSSAANPSVALLRGAAFGALAGLIVGVLFLLFLRLLHRLRT